jgi:peptidoglycan/LPS O-acetylase OafA/YrhL
MSVTPTDTAPRSRRTLASAYDHGQDNFLLLRFIAAAMVIVGHAYALSGIPGAADFVARAQLGNGLYTGSLAVDIFFVVSGFLVTGSYVRSGNLDTFVRSRALRVIPAYAICLFFCAFVIGPIYTEMSQSNYWASGSTYAYVITNLQFPNNQIWTLPGVFVHNGYPNVVNGSIWTLPAEVSMYLWVAALGMIGLFRKRWLANVALIALLIYGAYRPSGIQLINAIAEFARLAAFFLVGAFCFVNRHWIPISDWLLLALIVIAYFLYKTGVFPWVLGMVIAYGSLWFAYRPNLHFFNRFGDYSYGLYLWGFPVEQMVMHAFGAPTRPLWIFLVSFPLTLLCAIVSWHIVEKPALRLKRAGNG